MCGIAGFFDGTGQLGEGQAVEIITHMTGLLAHRGPDDDGIYLDSSNGIALGHRRLAVIDLNSGRQPLLSIDKSLCISFNGEIYNYKALRRELEALGYVFSTQSDTETILHGYHAWGEAVTEHLHGMFAFAIWDKARRQLFIARDRIGIKPLYYHWNGKSLVFASEMKAVTSHPTVELALDENALVNFLRFQYIGAPGTIYRQVNKLEPGCQLVLVAGDQPGLVKQNYWSISTVGVAGDRNEAERVSELRHRLEESVGARLMSDVPLGAFLSGGTDSSVVVSLMSTLMDDPVKTHTVRFTDPALDESGFAREIANRFATDHIESPIDVHVRDEIEQIIWHLDEPFADASAIPTYYLCREASKRVKVCLSGDGGDEIFAGYNWYSELQRLNSVNRFIPSIFLSMVSRITSSLVPDTLRGATFIKNIGAQAWRQHANLVSCFSDNEIVRLLKRGHGEVAAVENPIEKAYSRLSTPIDSVAAAQLVDIGNYLSEDILMKVDKMSMAHGLEVRIPLLDHKLVEWFINETIMLNQVSLDRKYYLKQSVSDQIPLEFFNREKQGFSAPTAKWLQEDLRDMVGDYLLSPDSSASGLFDRVEINKLWRKFTRSRFQVDISRQVWAILCFELWSRGQGQSGRLSR